MRRSKPKRSNPCLPHWSPRFSLTGSVISLEIAKPSPCPPSHATAHDRHSRSVGRGGMDVSNCPQELLALVLNGQAGHGNGESSIFTMTPPSGRYLMKLFRYYQSLGSPGSGQFQVELREVKPLKLEFLLVRGFLSQLPKFKAINRLTA